MFELHLACCWWLTPNSWPAAAVEGSAPLACNDGRDCSEEDPGDEGHGLSSFALEDGVVYQLLDRAPKGRDEANIPAGQWWWRRHDEYENDEGRTWPSG
jgi:hypothetical protein